MGDVFAIASIGKKDTIYSILLPLMMNLTTCPLLYVDFL